MRWTPERQPPQTRVRRGLVPLQVRDNTAPMHAPIGVFGGTFDPIHHGHLRLALELCEQLGLERVYVVPAKLPVHRDAPQASAAQRSEMVRRAVAGTTSLVLDERELRRPGPSFMVETLADFRGEFVDRPICLLLGMDAFAALHTWHRWREILDLAHVAVAGRPGAVLPTQGRVGTVVRERSTTQYGEISATLNGRIALGEIPGLDISSSGIRAALGQGRSPRYLLPAAVVEYIESEGLYTNAK